MLNVEDHRKRITDKHAFFFGTSSLDTRGSVLLFVTLVLPCHHCPPMPPARLKNTWIPLSLLVPPVVPTPNLRVTPICSMIKGRETAFNDIYSSVCFQEKLEKPEADKS
jgi:hypothetical protein